MRTCCFVGTAGYYSSVGLVRGVSIGGGSPSRSLKRVTHYASAFYLEPSQDLNVLTVGSHCLSLHWILQRREDAQGLPYWRWQDIVQIRCVADRNLGPGDRQRKCAWYLRTRLQWFRRDEEGSIEHSFGVQVKLSGQALPCNTMLRQLKTWNPQLQSSLC